MAIIKKKKKEGGGLFEWIRIRQKKNKRNTVYMSNYHKIY